MESLCRVQRIEGMDRRTRVLRGRRRWNLAVLFACGTLVSVQGPGCVIPLSSPVTSAAGDGGNGSSGAQTGPTPFGVGSISGTPPQGTWSAVTANLTNMDSECGNLSSVTAKPDEDLLLAGVATKGLWASRDGGMSWQALGVPDAGSAVITNRPLAVVFDPDPKNSMQYWESGIYGGGSGGGVYRTADDGTTFVLLGDSHHADLVSIDFTDPARRTLLAGGHEEQQTVHRSTDGGMTWTNVGGGLPPNSTCTLPLVLDAQTYLVGCISYSNGPNGVYRTADGGTTWTQVTPSGGAVPPLHASDGSIYWVSRDGKGMTRGSSDGQTWTDVTGAGVLASVSPVELPDGTVAAIGPSFGMQYVLVSPDHGATWHPVSSSLPYADERGLAYSSQRKTFFIWHFTCGSGSVPVPPDAIMRFDRKN